jgi:hypothetical protein
MINGRGFGTKRLRLNRGIILEIPWRDWRKS